MDPLDLLRQLLDPARLAVVGAVALGPVHTADIAADCDIAEREVLRTLAPLLQAGLVRSSDAGYHLDEAAWRDLARSLPQAAPPSPRVAFGITPSRLSCCTRRSERSSRRAITASGCIGDDTA